MHAPRESSLNIRRDHKSLSMASIAMQTVRAAPAASARLPAARRGQRLVVRAATALPAEVRGPMRRNAPAMRALPLPLFQTLCQWFAAGRGPALGSDDTTLKRHARRNRIVDGAGPCSSRSGLPPVAPLQVKTVTPVGDRVFVKAEEAEAKTVGGILLPSSAQKRPTQGTVQSAGGAKGVKVRGPWAGGAPRSVGPCMQHPALPCGLRGAGRRQGGLLQVRRHRAGAAGRCLCAAEGAAPGCGKVLEQQHATCG